MSYPSGDDGAARLFDGEGQRKYVCGGEWRRFLAAAARMDAESRTFCQLLAFTGCRVSEGLALTPTGDQLSKNLRVYFLQAETAVGHEVGHIYRIDHPSDAFVGRPIQDVAPDKLKEVDADRLGACFMGEKVSSINGLRHGGVALDPSFSNETRIAALEQFSMTACPTSTRPTTGSKSK